MTDDDIKKYALLPSRFDHDGATKAHERLVLFGADPIGKLLWSRMVLVDGTVVVMTASELLNLCGPSNAAITMVVPRNAHGKRMRILGMPGVLGNVTTKHAEGTVVTIATKDIRRCYLSKLDTIEAVAVRIAEADAESEASAKWMDEYRRILTTAHGWKDHAVAPSRDLGPGSGFEQAEVMRSTEVRRARVARARAAMSLRSDGHTFREIAESLGITRERARQIVSWGERNRELLDVYQSNNYPGGSLEMHRRRIRGTP